MWVGEVFFKSTITLSGVEFPWVPETGDVPLVCDASSSFLTHKIDVSKVSDQELQGMVCFYWDGVLLLGLYASIGMVCFYWDGILLLGWCASIGMVCFYWDVFG